jgi:crotonobetainyl-CoA:carnitine CoA-transferase CaiB-like acyl-CoA transferase
MPTGPLNGTVVLDLSRAIAGPLAAMVLGDLGARVIKVEGPHGGDDSRGWGPPFVGPIDERQSTYFMSVNRNKESIELDLKSAAGHDVLARLIQRADVLIENFRPGTLDRLGFSPTVLHTLNPRLVVLSITGFGHDGPEGGRAGYDQIAQGEGGLMALTGDAASGPMRIGVALTDVLAGVNGAVGVGAALAGRAATGRGTVVRTSLLAAAVSAHTFQGTKWTVSGEVARPTGNHHPQIAPYGSFRCRDGHLQIAVGSEGIWARLAPLIGLAPNDSRFGVNLDRVARRDELRAVIEHEFAHRDRDELLRDLGAAGVPAGAIRTIDEVYSWDQTLSQGLVVEVDHALAGRIQLPGPALRLESADGETQLRSVHLAPPTLGQHTEAVLAWLHAAEDDGDVARESLAALTATHHTD